MTDAHRQLIETICTGVLPNMVRIYESGRMNSALDRDQFVILMEQKVELANRSLKKLSTGDQAVYRKKIDAAYAENIDRIRKASPIPQPAGARNIPGSDPGRF